MELTIFKLQQIKQTGAKESSKQQYLLVGVGAM